MAHARLAPRCHGPGPGSSDEHSAGAHGDHLDHVEASAHTAVDKHLDVVADRVHDGGQRADRRGHRIELAAPVVGDDDAVDAGVHGAARVVGVEHALDDQTPGPVLAHPGDLVPGDARIELRVDPVPERLRGPRSGDGVLQVGERERPPAQRDVAHPSWVADEIDGPA